MNKFISDIERLVQTRIGHTIHFLAGVATHVPAECIAEIQKLTGMEPEGEIVDQATYATVTDVSIRLDGGVNTGEMVAQPKAKAGLAGTTASGTPTDDPAQVAAAVTGDPVISDMDAGATVHASGVTSTVTPDTPAAEGTGVSSETAAPLASATDQPAA